MQNSNNQDWQLWQQHNHPIEILNTTMFYQKMEYIHRNPIEAGFVENEEVIYTVAQEISLVRKGLLS